MLSFRDPVICDSVLTIRLSAFESWCGNFRSLKERSHLNKFSFWNVNPKGTQREARVLGYVCIRHCYLYGYYRAASFKDNELTLFESLSIAVGVSEFLFTRSLDKDVTYQDFN